MSLFLHFGARASDTGDQLAQPEKEMANLGHGVMDDARIEAAAYCLVKH